MSANHCGPGSEMMVSTVHGRALVVLLLFGLCSAGCSVDKVVYEGRPCETDDHCSGGTTCDLASKTCTRPGAADAGKDLVAAVEAGKDGKPPAPDKLKTPDARLPDQLKVPDLKVPDQLKVPDAGCPKGYTKCGLVCANLQTDLKHCGKCNNACPGGAADACAGGTCRCGTGGSCTKGLTCVAKICRCVAGALCNGCCDGDVCRGLGSQSATKCGAGGTKCLSCLDNNPCTNDNCSAAGACVHTNNSGSSCNDNDPCTTNDKCQLGKCKGQTQNCNDGLSCTADACDKSKGGCINKVLTGYCAINKACYKSGALHPSMSCLRCLPSESPASWTAAKGCVSTLAGSGQTGCTNGLASAASFNGPTGMAVDASGRIYVAEISNNIIRTIYKGQVSTLAGVCKKSGSADGPAASATFNGPQGVAVDSAGNVYVADNGNYRIRKISGGKVTTFAGSSKGYAEGAALSAKFSSPQDLVSTSSGTLYVVDTTNNRIRRISGGKVSTLAGSGTYGSKDGSLLKASFMWPHTISMDSAGTLYVGESYYVRKISGSQVTTLVKPTAGCVGLSNVQGTAATAKLGKVYIADYSGHRIRVYSLGKLSTLTGTCQTKGSTDGPLSKALFNYPNGLVLRAGKLYVSDYQNHRIRVIVLP